MGNFSRREILRLAAGGALSAAFVREAGAEIRPNNNIRADLVTIPGRDKPLYAVNHDVPLRPASETKIVSYEPLLYAVSKGLIGLDEKIPFTAAAHNATRGTKWNVSSIKSATVLENMQLGMGCSLNNAPAAAAEFMFKHPKFRQQIEHLDPKSFRTPEEGFVKTIMQQRSDEMGLAHSQWGNTNGLKPEDTDRSNSPPNVSTLEDLNRAATHNWLRYGDILIQVCAIPQFVIGGNKYNNTNRLLESSTKDDLRTPGLLAMKTAYIELAGHGIVTICERDVPFGNDYRRSTVVTNTVGHTKSLPRFAHAQQLNDVAFQVLELEFAREFEMLERRRLHPDEDIALLPEFDAQGAFKTVLQERQEKPRDAHASYEPLEFESYA